ncbi:MAG: type II toxin-antitoxin system HicB family antitoxin [Mariprofundales bacterium]
MYAYPVNLQQDGHAMLVTFPDIPEAITFGEDKAEALLQAQDALDTALEMYVDDQRPFPTASAPNGRPTVAPSALVQAKLGLHVAMQQQNMKKSALARRLGWHMPQVDRVLDMHHASQLRQIEQAATALGYHLDITIHN